MKTEIICCQPTYTTRNAEVVELKNNYTNVNLKEIKSTRNNNYVGIIKG